MEAKSAEVAEVSKSAVQIEIEKCKWTVVID